MKRTRRLGRYHLTERVAYGGMAEVFRGFTFDADGNRYDVAVKRLLSHLAADPQFVTMLTDEYRLVSRLDHPSIAKVYELAEVEGELLIAMEYVDGKDLRSTAEKALKDQRPLNIADIAYLMARSLDGLHHAHMSVDDAGAFMGVVHRDFSPSNILIGYDGEVKICDFGIAKGRQARAHTRGGVIKGKARYMSPEQAHGHDLDHRSDLFSAGSVLYELCTGQPAFRGRTEVDLILAVRAASPPDPRTLNQQLPESMARIIAQAMAPQPEQRFQSALAFRDALIRFLRAHAPRYRRTWLARFMKVTWEAEIDQELRVLEEYAIDASEHGEEYGRNLLAEDLPEGAPYAGFSPRPPQ